MSGHELRFYGTLDAPSAVHLMARCDCGWHTILEPGHTLADLCRLAAQHTGHEEETQ